VHRAAPRALLVADGNQGMNASQALNLVHRLAKTKVRLEFFEQPFPKHDLPLMRAFRKKSKIPLFADESVLTPSDAMRVFDTGAADGVVIKLAKSGLLGALDIIQAARRFGKKLAIGCMEESKLGLAASVHLACGTGIFEWVDLDSVFLIDEPVKRGGFRVNGARLSVAGIRSGIGM
jgi:L-alanine-DL-glutamate epimerase-like enolase superfamily enzyme